MNTLDVLLGYKNRQVVLSEYQGDELLSRDGCFFDHIQSNDNSIEFIRDNQTVQKLIINHLSPIVQLSGFSHHYAIHHNGLRIELYFPSV
jgi:hypothetical protein